ncbi:hypothetical protein ABTP55_19660, partial [Acinetobacter baumannii]
MSAMHFCICSETRHAVPRRLVLAYTGRRRSADWVARNDCMVHEETHMTLKAQFLMGAAFAAALLAGAPARADITI